MRIRSLAALVAAALVPAAASASPALTTQPSQPFYAQPVTVKVSGFNQWLYIPAMRHTRSGNTLSFDYEYASDFFGPARPDFGNAPVPLGEMTPGTYSARLVFHDIARPTVPPEAYDTTFVVPPPDQPGAYLVPVQPRAQQAANIVLVGSHNLDPASVRVAVQGTVVTVSYQYAADSPVDPSRPPPAGLVPWTVVPLAALASGDYTLQWQGTPRAGGAANGSQRTFQVLKQSAVVEFYAESTDHYFMSLDAADIDLLDRPGSGWKRTGYEFFAFQNQAEAPAGAQPICRFYASGPNSHFYAAPADCAYLKNQETQLRAEAAKAGTAYTGWAYERIAFYAILPSGEQCPANTNSVWRAYNNRAAQNDSNHRYASSGAIQAAMSFTWQGEGVKFCSPT